MANDFSGNPWIIDTASSEVVFDDDWRGHLAWVTDDGADTDSIVLKDKNGRKIWERHHDGSEDTYQSYGIKPSQYGFFKGLIVDTLSAGTLYIYYE